MSLLHYGDFTIAGVVAIFPLQVFMAIDDVITVTCWLCSAQLYCRTEGQH